MVIDIPAGRHQRFAASAAASVVGQEFDLDEQIAGIGGLIVQSLSADERGLWTRARVVDAEVVRDGNYLRLTIEAA
jgi:hypothetical protein